MGLPVFQGNHGQKSLQGDDEISVFDKKETRHVRLQDDKFALVSATWNKLIQNRRACYKPSTNIIIDELLFPTSTQCRFI